MKLKPCWHCEGEVEIEQYGDRRRSTIYACQHCGARLETGEEWEHGRDWNDRPIEERLERELAEAKRQTDAWASTAFKEFRNQKKQAFEAGRKVKPLVWEEDENEPGTFHAYTEVDNGRYTVFQPAEKDYWNVWSNHKKVDFIAQGVASKEEAMQRADDFLAARVHSLLEYDKLWQIPAHVERA